MVARFGPYVVLGELGRGGVGVVLRARDPASGRDVALKTLQRADERTLARFGREVEALAALDHPGIVKVHASGLADDGRPYIVCELVEGARPLDEAADGLPLAQRVALVRDAARALGHAHARGVVHRDVKAENLLVDAQGRVRVTDFGLAAMEDRERLTRTGAVVGTPMSMSPEQVRGSRETAHPTTDVWALGVALYRALTGCMPFEGRSLPELFGRICQADPVPPRRRAPEVPAPVEAVCLRALAPEPEERWPDGEAMAGALDAALRGERVAGRRRRWTRPLLWAAAPVGSALVLAAAWLYEPPAPAPLDPPRAASAAPVPYAAARATTVPPAGAAPRRPTEDPAALRAKLEVQGRTDPAARVRLGVMLVSGEGGPPERRRGMGILEDAGKERGDLQASMALARFFRAGIDRTGRQGPPVLDSAAWWWRASISAAERAGDRRVTEDCRAELADTLLERGTQNDLNEAFDLFEKAARNDSPLAHLLLAEHVLAGRFGFPSPDRARALLKELKKLDAGYQPDRVAALLRRCDEAARR